MTVDEIVSKYILDSSGYVTGAKTVLNATDKLRSKVSELGGSAIRGSFDFLKTATMSIGLASIPLIAGAKHAVDSALAYDTLKRTLTAVTYSAERTGQILAFVDKLAIPSIFTTAELGDSAKTLEAFGLTTERFLPIAEKLGTVFGGTKDKLDSFVGALGYIKNQRFGEAFESLARGGVSRQALMQEGLKFDKGGSYLGSVEQALSAVEKIVNQKFGKLSQEMASGPAARLASFTDQMDRAFRQIGAVLIEFALPIVDALAGALENIVKSGVFKNLTEGLTGMFNTKTIGDALISTLAGVLAGVMMIPRFVDSLKKSFVQNFGTIRENIEKVAVGLAFIFVTGTIVKGILNVIKVLELLRKGFMATTVAEGVMEAGMTGGLSLAKTLLGITVAVATLGGIYYGVSQAIEGMANSVDDLGSSIADMPDIQEWAKKKAEIEKALKGESTTTAVGGAVGGAGATGGEKTTEQLRKENNQKLADAEIKANLRLQQAERELDRQKRLYERSMALARANPQNEDMQKQLELSQGRVLQAQKDVKDAREQRRKANEDYAKGFQSAGTGDNYKAMSGIADALNNQDYGFADSLKSIADSSKKTAENTESLKISDKILGGGSLASRGLSKEELSNITANKRGGAKEIKSILVELGVAIERNMNQTTAKAFGNNVSRREV